MQSRRSVNIWRVDLSEPYAQARKVVSSSREQTAPNISPDGTQIAFQSNRSGSQEVWVSDSDGSNAIQLSSFGIRMTGSPHWSPDGNLIAFDSRAGGEANIYIVDPHGWRASEASDQKLNRVVVSTRFRARPRPTQPSRPSWTLHPFAKDSV